MKFDMIISDYDGTLGNGTIIEKETLNAIKEYEKRGGKFVICTGRPYPSIAPICDQYDIKGLLACSQGALIIDIETNTKLREGGLNFELANEAVKAFQKEGVEVIVDINDNLYCERECMYTDYHKKYCKPIIVENLSKLVLDKKEVVRKVIASAKASAIYKATQKGNELFKGRAICNNGSDEIMEMINPDFSKGAAVRFLGQYFNIPLHKIMTIGDSTNDIELMAGDWHGVAVGSANDELKKKAKEVTVPFDKQPIKHLIEKYCL